MSAMKKPKAKGGNRRYTGFDGEASGEAAALKALRQQIAARFPFTHNLGTWVIRPMRNKTSPSVHGTGRAWDCGWSGNYEKNAVPLANYFVEHADALGIEMILDYFVGHGRGWRCDRKAWTVYDKPTISGAPGGQWLHVEISPSITVAQVLAHFEAGKQP